MLEFVRLQTLLFSFDRAKREGRLGYPTVNKLFERHYTVILADRANGLVRRFTLSLRPALITLGVLAALPILMGLGAKWSARSISLTPIAIWETARILFTPHLDLADSFSLRCPFDFAQGLGSPGCY